MHCSEIRQRFINYYQQRGFHLLPRAPMRHPSIPMSFVMSAGLVQVETSLAKTTIHSGILILTRLTRKVYVLPERFDSEAN